MNEEEVGYIYCLSNPTFGENIYKIGFTKRTPAERAAELHTTGIAMPFKIEFAKKVRDYKGKEKSIHTFLELNDPKYRINKNREFFKIKLELVKALFDIIDGEWYINNNEQMLNERQLQTMTVKELKSICNQLQISKSGTKSVIIQRIIEKKNSIRI